MSPIRRMVRGMTWGAGIAGTYWLADLTGAFIAIGWLFVPSTGGWLLLAAASAFTLLAGAVVGALFAALWPILRRAQWPARWRLFLGLRSRLLTAAAMTLAVAATGAVVRIDRNLATPKARPPLSAAHPAPILWLVIDTLRADALYQGDFAGAPAVRALARDALIFSDAEASAGWTIPSTATLLTGIHNTTMDASAGYLPSWAPTLAERLWAAGFETRAVVDNVILEPRNGFAAGFETFAQRSAFRFAFSLPSFRILPTSVREGLRAAFFVSYHGAPGTTDAAIEMIGEAHERPLFLYVHYMDPHAPYYPHPEQGPEPDDGAAMTFWRARDRLRVEKGPLPSDAQMKLLRHRYAGEVQFVDSHVGRLLAAWHARFGDTGMVMVTADHGEEFLEHGHLSHSLTVNREVVHVPLLLQLPAGAVPANRSRGVVDIPVSQIDLVPTTLELVGVDPSQVEGPRIQGHSWIAWLRGETPPIDRPIIGSHSRHGRRIYRYREGPWVFIRTAYYDERAPNYELFDLDADPREQIDLFNRAGELAPGIAKRCDELAIALLEAADPKSPNASHADEETLRAMGYIQ